MAGRHHHLPRIGQLVGQQPGFRQRQAHLSGRPRGRHAGQHDPVQRQPHPVAAGPVDPDHPPLDRAVIAIAQHLGVGPVRAQPRNAGAGRRQRHGKARDPRPSRDRAGQPPRFRPGGRAQADQRRKQPDHGQRQIERGPRLILQREPAADAEGQADRRPQEQARPRDRVGAFGARTVAQPGRRAQGAVASVRVPRPCCVDRGHNLVLSRVAPYHCADPSGPRLTKALTAAPSPNPDPP